MKNLKRKITLVSVLSIMAMSMLAFTYDETPPLLDDGTQTELQDGERPPHPGGEDFDGERPPHPEDEDFDGERPPHPEGEDFDGERPPHSEDEDFDGERPPRPEGEDAPTDDSFVPAAVESTVESEDVEIVTQVIETTIEDGEYEITFSGGFETVQEDGGRPVNLIGAALGVSSEVFRDAFSNVTPEDNGHLNPETAQANKAILLGALESYGVTNDWLDTVTNYYRYRADYGQMWPTANASATAIVEDGVMTVVITNAGSGYNTVPTLSIDGESDLDIDVTMSYGSDLATNGHISSIEIQ